jgi:hypothetical protein
MAAILGLALAAALIRWANLGTAARAAAWPVGLLLTGVVASAWLAAVSSGNWTRFGQFSWLGRAGFFPQLAAYAPWALLQQWLLLSYLNTRIRRTVPRTGWLGLPGRVITTGLTGLAFGAMHAPNVPLALLTFAGGCVSGWLFQRDRSRNLSVVALAHGLAGTLLATLTTVPMNVGPRV